MKQVTILGDGGWGTALGLVLQRNGHRVRMWGPFPEYLSQIRRRHENVKFLPGIRVPAEMEWIAEKQVAVDDADLVLVAVPSRFYRSVLESFAPLIPAKSMVLSVSKGLDQQTHDRLSASAEKILGRATVAALSGPSHAEEVARRIPTAVVIACRDHAISHALQEMFNSPEFRIYTSDDVVGVEMGGALKNIIAIAAGVSDGIGFGDNTKAALITRGLAEITRLGCALGANRTTFSGLSGIGDLIVTCASNLSRNRSVGERLGQGESIEKILGSMEQVAEGVWTCAAALDLARKHGVEVPITEQVFNVVKMRKDPRKAVQDLMSRDPKAEREDF